MARTPLLRALQRLARDHQRAEALGIAPAELREREREQSYSRGEFLKRSGAAGAAVALGSGVFPRSALAAGGPSIAIVGGGIAGLTAALTLQDRGIMSVVYESHATRGGGR